MSELASVVPKFPISWLPISSARLQLLWEEPLLTSVLVPLPGQGVIPLSAEGKGAAGRAPGTSWKPGLEETFPCCKQDENSRRPDSLSLYPLPLARFAHTSMVSRYHLAVRGGV